MPCVHEKSYYKLMEVNKHHHWKALSKSLEEGEELNINTIIEKASLLEASEEPVDTVDPTFIFDTALLPTSVRK